MRKSRDAVPCCVASPRWTSKGISSLMSGLWFVTDHKLRGPTFLPTAQLGFPHFATNGTCVTRRHVGSGEEPLPPGKGTWLMQELSAGWSTISKAPPFSSGTRKGWGHFYPSEAEWL